MRQETKLAARARRRSRSAQSPTFLCRPLENGRVLAAPSQPLPWPPCPPAHTSSATDHFRTRNIAASSPGLTQPAASRQDGVPSSPSATVTAPNAAIGVVKRHHGRTCSHQRIAGQPTLDPLEKHTHRLTPREWLPQSLPRQSQWQPIFAGARGLRPRVREQGARFEALARRPDHRAGGQAFQGARRWP